MARAKASPENQPVAERRIHTLRRQFNDSFCDEGGHIAIAKVIAVAGQIMLLYYTARYFADMIPRWETLTVCLSFIIAPDVAKKLIAMKYGNGTGAAAK